MHGCPKGILIFLLFVINLGKETPAECRGTRRLSFFDPFACFHFGLLAHAALEESEEEVFFELLEDGFVFNIGADDVDGGDSFERLVLCEGKVGVVDKELSSRWLNRLR